MVQQDDEEHGDALMLLAVCCCCWEKEDATSPRKRVGPRIVVVEAGTAVTDSDMMDDGKSIGAGSNLFRS